MAFPILGPTGTRIDVIIETLVVVYIFDRRGTTKVGSNGRARPSRHRA